MQSITSDVGPEDFGRANPRPRLVAGTRRVVRTVFPTPWSQVFGWVALSCLVVLTLSGLYLALFFDPSMAEVIYGGSVQNLRGVAVSQAYASALEISFEVRAGLFVRQVHNWAGSLFLASLLAGLLVRFFTGTFRRPYRAVWTVGAVLLIVGVFEAFTGVLLLDDLLSGTSLRVTSGYILAIPVIGTWLHWIVFGGEFPGTEIIPRLYLVHLGLAAVIVALGVVGAWLGGRHCRRFERRPKRRGAVRVRTLPVVASRAAATFTATVAALAVLGGAFQVNPVWAYGPADPAHVSAGSMPPWYLGWVDGAVRLWPAWEVQLGGYTIAPWFWPSTVFLSLSFGALALYPWLERRVTGDDALHHRPQRPRDVPVRTSLGVAVATFYGCLQLAAAIDVLAFVGRLSTDALFWAGRIGVLVLPVVAFAITHRLCLGLQRSARAEFENGVDTGVIRRLPNGGFVAVHRPRAGLAASGPPVAAERATLSSERTSIGRDANSHSDS